MGRTLAFDRDEVLTQVMELFWRQGYRATSISDLARQTRLKPGSLYHSFESKHALLLEALERYGRQRVSWIQGLLGRHLPLEGLIRSLLDGMIDKICDDPDAKGCLLLNTKLELGAGDALVAERIELIYGRIEAEIESALQRGKKLGELKSDCDTAQLAKFVLMSTWGLRVLGLNRPERAQLEAMAEQVMLVLRAHQSQSQPKTEQSQPKTEYE